MSLLRQLGNQTIIYGLGQILPKVFHFIIFSSYLTYRLATKEEYAIYLDLYAYVSILIVICSYRMDTALFRFGRKKEDLDNTYQSALLPMAFTSILAVLLGCYFSEELARLLTYPGRGYYVRWFSFIIAFDVLALLPLARLRLQDKARVFVIFKIINVILTVVLLLFFLEVMPRFFPSLQADLFNFVQSDVDYAFISNLIASIIIFLALFFYQFPKSVRIDRVLWKKMLSYSWPLIIVGVAGGINQFFGVPLQKYLLGDAIIENKNQAAVYGAVQKIPALLAMFTTAYNYAAEPFFFKNADHKDARQLYGDIAHFFIVLAGGMAIVIYLGIDVFGFLIAPKYHEGFYLIPILLMAYLFLGIYYNVSIWYKLSDKTQYGAIIASIGAVITLVGSYTLLPLIGVDASAWMALLCYVSMVVLAYLLGKKHYPINYPLIPMLRQISLIVGILITGHFLRTDQVAFNLITGVILVSIYCFITWRLDKKRLLVYL